ncbi:ATP-binding protein [Streptomyces sp. NPDC090073]|uniref:ATP-binding protein n=1 Tax=Streptomyces sp. NPDC090073 TaxID=3365936 RepID=UPI0038146F0E
MMAADATRRDETAFAGRHNEMARLLAGLEHLPAVILLEGEAGVGKSRLLREATAGMSAMGLRVVRGHCHPLRVPYPFHPVAEALRTLLQEFPHAMPRTPSGAAIGEVLATSARKPPRGGGYEDASGPAVAYELLADLKRLLTLAAPVVLVVEDLHWSDEASRELLLLLARSMPEGVGLVLSYRRADLPPQTPLLGAVYGPQPGVHSVEIQVGPLPVTAVRELAAHTLGGAVPLGVAERLHSRSDGVPRVLMEDLAVLGALLRRRPGGRDDLCAMVDPLGVPRVIRESVAATLQTMSPEAVAVIRAAAALGAPFDQTLVTEVAGLEPDSAAAGIVAALAAHVLCEDGAMTYTFQRSIARMAVYENIPGPEKRRLHRRAISALWTRPSPPLAHIARQARWLGETGTWIQQATAAAEQAIALGDRTGAVRTLLEVVEAPAIDPDRLAHAGLVLARNSFHLAQHSETVRALRRVLALAGLPAFAHAELTLHVERLAVVHAGDSSRVGNLRGAVVELQTCPELAASAASALAMAVKDDEESRTWLAEAERAAAASADEWDAAVVRTAVLTHAAEQGDKDVWGTTENLHRHSPDPAVALETNHALCSVGAIAVDLGLDTRARRLLNVSDGMARSLGSDLLRCQSATALLRLDWWAGAWTGLEQRLEKLYEQYSEMATAVATRSIVLASLSLARGEQDLAHLHLDRVWDKGGHSASGWARAVLARMHMARGEAEEAWSLVAPSVKSPQAVSPWRQAHGLLPVAVEAALATGRVNEARATVMSAERATEGRCMPAPQAEAHQARGHMHVGDDPARAVEHYEQSRSLWHDIGRPYQAALVSEEQAEALLRQGLQDAAAARLRAALTTYIELGAGYDESRCRHTLGKIGEDKPRPRGRRSYGQQLSPRELEVARLVAEGAANREIARDLYLSLRTVEHHVTRILRKLNVSHRHAVRDALDRRE